MPLVGGCILAVLLGLIGMVVGSTVKGLTKARSDDLALWVGCLATAFLIAVAVAGGTEYGKMNPGPWRNASIGVLMWVFSHAVLLSWALFILGIDGSDGIRTVVISGAVAAVLTVVFCLINDTFLGAPLDAMMEASVNLTRKIHRAVGRRVWMR
jgi:hypothetical protein